MTPPPYVSRWRLALVALIVVAAMLTLLSRLWDLQMHDERDVSEKIRKQTTVAERLSPARGSVLDRNGVPLAENRASFDVDFYLDELVRQYKRQHHGYLPKIGIRHRQGKRYVDREEPNIGEIIKDGADQLSKILGRPVDLNAKDLQDHYYQSPSIPFQYQTNIDFATLARFSEHNLGLPGIDISVRPIRYYNYGAMASHILGYVGRPLDPEATFDDGHQLETVGHSGLEQAFDDKLQGVPGGRISRINNRGYIVGQESYNAPTVGNSLYLTIDSRIQYICEQVMREHNVGRGAFVVMNPNNGDILAMVSVPSYDPNDFIPKVDKAKWKEWNTDPTAPLINRAVESYPPGSTYKILIASSALKTGAITPSTVIPCPPFITIAHRDYHNAEENLVGDFSLHQAMAESCNVFFYQVGIRTGIKAIDEMGQVVGFGQKTGLPIQEKAGVLPGPEWLAANRPKESWSEAYTALTSIGQQYVAVTPVQMAVLVSAVANWGTLYTPRLATGISSLTGETLQSFPVQVRGQMGLKTSDMDALRNSLLGVVEDAGGTGTAAKIPGIGIAGKTGTADHFSVINHVRKRDKTTWFVSFAPYDKPRYTVIGVVEGGSFGGSTVAPLAHEIYQQIFAMDDTNVAPKLTYLKPAVGNFNGATDLVVSTDPASTAAAATTPTDSFSPTPDALPPDGSSLTPTALRRYNPAYSR